MDRNLVSLDYERSKRGLRRKFFIRIYSVKADIKTGQWITEPIPTGKTTTSLKWAREESTSEYQCTTYTPPDTEEVRALIIKYM